MEQLNILIGGKLGDFFHSLILPKYIHEASMGSTIINIYICNHEKEIFSSGLEKTYEELLPIMNKQSYVNVFKIYEPNVKIDIDLTKFRDLENLFTTSWNEFYLRNYIKSDLKVPFGYSWIDFYYKPMYKDLLLINRNTLPYVNADAEEVYKNYIDAYKGNVYFVCSWLEQYEQFSLRDSVPMLYLPNLEDMITAIGSCKHFLGNLTATAAIATAVNKNRTVEIFSDLIRTKYIHEMKYYDNLICIQ